MRTVETTVYSFDELSDKAKEKAREWFREASAHDEFWECIYDDAATIAKLMGIDLLQKSVKLMGGGTRYDPCIWFSGFYSQGDGACFEGSWEHKADASAAVREHASQDEELHKIADGLGADELVGLSARVKQTGRGSHEMCTHIEVFDLEGDEAGDDEREIVKDLLRDFMRWIYRQLKQEYEYQNSDEVVDENIRANEYEFEEDGSRA